MFSLQRALSLLGLLSRHVSEMILFKHTRKLAQVFSGGFAKRCLPSLKLIFFPPSSVPAELRRCVGKEGALRLEQTSLG